jgi:hypothetical protein
MTSNSPRPAASYARKGAILTLEAAAFITIFLGLVYLFARNCPLRSTRNPRKKEIEEGFRSPHITEFLISENQRF